MNPTWSPAAVRSSSPREMEQSRRWRRPAESLRRSLIKNDQIRMFDCTISSQDEEEDFGPGRLAKYQKMMWDLIEKPDTSIAAKSDFIRTIYIYMIINHHIFRYISILSTSFVAVSIVGMTISTMPALQYEVTLAVCLTFVTNQLCRMHGVILQKIPFYLLQRLFALRGLLQNILLGDIIFKKLPFDRRFLKLIFFLDWLDLRKR